MVEHTDGLEAVYLPVFQKTWRRLGLSDEELDELAEEVLANPYAGPVMPGTGGARKVRYALGNRGKSAGARIIYVNFSEFGKVYFITVYSKHDKPNLSARERELLKTLIARLEEQLREKSN